MKRRKNMTVAIVSSLVIIATVSHAQSRNSSACRGEKTAAQLTDESGAHAGQVMAWKKQLLEGAAGLVEDSRSRHAADDAFRDRELHEQIGRLKIEVESLKKTLPSSVERLKRCIEPEHKELSIVRPCALVGLAHSSWYYRAAGESAENLSLMLQIAEQYLRYPFYGSRKSAVVLSVNRRRVQWLMRVMGNEPIDPRGRTTWPGAGEGLGNRAGKFFRRLLSPRTHAFLHQCGYTSTLALKMPQAVRN